MIEHKAMEADQLAALNQILKQTKYKPVSKISYGSFGQIFKIQDSQKQYVLKVISKQKMAKQSKIHEAVIQGFVLSRMKHPGVIKYYQTIQTKQYICQVLEYCQYGDLFSLMKKVNRNMQLVQKKKQIAQFYLAQILQGLAYIHQKKLIHRDVKLQNVVVSADLNAKIVDFGTAKPVNMQDFYSKQQIQFISKLRKKPSDVQEQQVVRSKSFVGSANYLSPQSIGLQYSLASDIWSYGILAYKLFHGKLPFEGQNNFQIFKKIKQNQIVINQKMQPDIQDLIKKCLKLKPEQRPTALQLKKHPYFKNVKFQQIYTKPCPINKQILLKMYNAGSSINRQQSTIEKDVQYQVGLQKKMFFGNYKPRILKVYRKGQGLYMSYWYLDGKTPKNEFQLMINDYAIATNKLEFDVCNRDVKYTFKVIKGTTVDQVVSKINSIIRKHFQLD